ncbi:MAG: GNAT family N-acetyltransferase [Acidimicrobiaceae bacterium]|nr:GNAT family N-acetyltransferase [Acidimicrobiaceae bacterium]
MMETFVRQGSKGDTDVLEILESEARLSLAEFRGGDRLSVEVPIIGPKWALALEDRSLHVLVGGLDESVMGFLVVRIKDQIAIIEQVFVTHDARTLGVGDALVSAIIVWAKSNSFKSLDALALPGDRETKNLYERSGLVARLITVTKTLE